MKKVFVPAVFLVVFALLLSGCVEDNGQPQGGETSGELANGQGTAVQPQDNTQEMQSNISTADIKDFGMSAYGGVRRRLFDYYLFFAENGAAFSSTEECSELSISGEGFCVGAYSAKNGLQDMCENHEFGLPYLFFPMCETCGGIPRKDAPANSMFEMCYIGYGLTKKDAGECRSFPDMQNRGNVPEFSDDDSSPESIREESCVYGVAIGTNDEGLCEQAGFFRDLCYSNFALKKESISICENVEDEYLLSRCIEQTAPFSENVENCFRVTAVERDGGPVAYSNIPGTGMSDSTAFKRDLCVVDFARNKRVTDRSVCERIESSDYKSFCLQVIAVNSKDPELCSLDFISQQGYVDNCLAELAVELKDISICDKASGVGGCTGTGLCTDSGSGRSRCIRSYAISVGNVSLCDQTDDKEGCMSLVGVNSGDASICNRLTEERRRKYCFDQVAKETGDASLCNQLEDFSKKQCILNVVAATRNPSGCELIEPSEKEYCQKTAKS